MMNRPLLLFIKRQLPRERRNSFEVYYVFSAFTASMSMCLMAFVMLRLEQPHIATSALVSTLMLIGTLALWAKGLSQDLQKANLHKDQFLTIVSHEMRTPLNAVMGYLNLMETDERINLEAKEFVTGAQNAAAHLLTVINDLLDYSQIQNGKITLNLHTKRHNTHGSLTPRAIDFGLSYNLYIDPQVPDWIKADQHRLTQVLINLLGNALKFTDKGRVNTHVHVEPSAKTPQSGTLCVHVTDTKPGIALAEQARIFDPLRSTHTHRHTCDTLWQTRTLKQPKTAQRDACDCAHRQRSERSTHGLSRNRV